MDYRHAVTLTLLGSLLLPAQETTGPQSRLVAQQQGTLKIVVVEGEGAKNNIRSRTATAPVVQVLDEAEKPAAGAEVVIQLPLAGPGGVFHGWLKTQTVRADQKGQASVTGYAPNDEEGRFNIKVTATLGAKTGTAVIAQANVRNGTGGTVSKKRSGLWKVVAIVGGGVVVGGVVAGSRGDKTTAAAATVPVSITTGPITVGGPR